MNNILFSYGHCLEQGRLLTLLIVRRNGEAPRLTSLICVAQGLTSQPFHESEGAGSARDRLLSICRADGVRQLLRELPHLPC